jgi:hypothetical protein
MLLITDGQTYFEDCKRKYGCTPRQYAFRKAKEAKENDMRLVAVCAHVGSYWRSEGDSMYYWYGGHRLPLDSSLKRFVDTLAALSGGVAFHLTPNIFEIECTKVMYDILEASLKPRIEETTSVIYGYS